MSDEYKYILLDEDNTIQDFGENLKALVDSAPFNGSDGEEMRIYKLVKCGKIVVPENFISWQEI